MHSLTIAELQAACVERGMRSLGVSEARLRTQLEQWVELHLVKKVPATLLLLSRSLYMPEYLPVEDRIVAAIQALPEHAVRLSLTLYLSV